MGKSLPSTTRLQEFAKIFTSNRLQISKPIKPVSKTRLPEPAKPTKGIHVELEHQRLRLKKKMEGNSEQPKETRLLLSEVVSDCVKRWFQDTLKEAKAGDSAMQVLVGQMYHSGYGVPRDAQKGRAWISRASKSRSSVWKVSDKHPGYNASDSDSDDMKVDAK
ncbi:unnamed protein product [Ilex paraguariensis]|uniref:Sel1-like protein n=1 Tax=Ilex paraguariensis TaxID=185542 RepID=A0ABC8UAW4_9AQUA